MRNLKIVGAAFLLGTSSLAFAQEEETEQVEIQGEFGAEVSAEAQLNAGNGSIGGWVSERARARVEDSVEAGSEDAESQGVGLAVSTAARQAAQAEIRDGGVAADVLLETNANAGALDAVTAAGSTAAQGQAQAATARQNASTVLDSATAARSNASAVVDTAMAARENASAVVDTAMAARGSASAAVEAAAAARANASAVAEQARAAREIAAAARGR